MTVLNGVQLPELDQPRIGGGGRRLPPLAAMFAVDEVTGCWNWTGQISGQGYGKIGVGRKHLRAHRVVYAVVRGELADDASLDHLCRNRACVNPEHLEPVDTRTNLLRGQTLAAANAAKTHCDHGHPLSGDNLRILRSGSRNCRECGRRSNRARSAQKNEWARKRRAERVSA